jgi:hypothetical protein
MTIAEARFPHVFLPAFACVVLIGFAQPCSAQNGLHGPLPPIVSAPSPSPPAPPQTGLGGIADRVKGYERNAPDREDRVHIGLGTEHVNAIFGGLGQGSGVAFGVQFTTADDLPGVELSAAAIVSTKLYRAFEVEAYVPSVGSENTHADFRFRYLRRTKDNFFGLGPDTGDLVVGTFPGFPNIPLIAPAFSSEAYETNYDVEQRRTAGALFHDFTENFQAGVYVQYVSASTYEGDDDKDPPLGTFFFPAGTPPIIQIPPPPGQVARIPVPGLFTGSKILTEGVYAEYDTRSNDDGLTKGFYAYGRLANHDGIGDIDSPPFFAQFPVPPGFFDLFASDLNDFGWIGATFDVRGYIPLGTDRASLALRYFRS